MAAQSSKRKTFTKGRGYAALWIFGIAGMLGLYGVLYNTVVGLFGVILPGWLAVVLYLFISASIVYLVGRLGWREAKADLTQRADERVNRAWAEGQADGRAQRSGRPAAADPTYVGEVGGWASPRYPAPPSDEDASPATPGYTQIRSPGKGVEQGDKVVPQRRPSPAATYNEETTSRPPRPSVVPPAPQRRRSPAARDDR